MTDSENSRLTEVGSPGSEAGRSEPGPSGPAVLFPGQGAQSVGMLGPWADGQPAVTELFDRASSILGYDLAEICRNGPAERLNTTAYSQPALLVTSLAALKVLEGREDSPLPRVRMTAGLSLGEYTALVYAGSCRGRAWPGHAGLCRGDAWRNGGRVGLGESCGCLAL